MLTNARGVFRGEALLMKVYKMALFPYDAVVFDLDGTLFEAEEGILSSVRNTMREMNLPIPAGADLRQVIGPPLRASFVELLQVPENRAEEAMERYRQDFSARGMYCYCVYPHIRPMLESLKGLKLGQTPDAVLTDVEAAMEAMGEVTGATVREDITARIFERFCVGK